MSDNQKAKLEAILFLLAKPLKYSKLAKDLNIKVAQVKELVNELAREKNNSHSGIHIFQTDDEVSLVTNPELNDFLSSFVKAEKTGNLTPPQLETLTVIAYRGPITKAEIEQIRGVNCSIILRNLLMRGLIEEKEDDQKIMPVYTLSSLMLRELGIHNVSELPDYNALHKNAKIEQMLNELT
ncbi:SMC-Scp complex subunit ScpB [Candidatus Parcubacteria bacterium]|nr:MAG: SMC-Scp complex subunit ScpB [Candidatus Parcubacteria bacterium]